MIYPLMQAPEEEAGDPLLDVVDAPWKQLGDRNYPPWYFYSLGRYTAHPQDVERMRQAIRGTPRVIPERYDILFNALLHTWDIVCWAPATESILLAGEPAVRAVLEPVDVYSIPAKSRDPGTLGEWDWEQMRRRCVTLRGGDTITEEMKAANAEWQRAEEARLADAEYDLASYYKGLFRRMADETGLGDLPPEEMARRFGGLPAEWDMDTE